ncbi:THxN family PEP-CTERM protein [Alteromonas sp. S167]|uniref:THxN family PEP-CTERM protein n=1 Tax=Alteromonas sp. S167 TaxID=3117402 RepID=UPI002FDFE042
MKTFKILVAAAAVSASSASFAMPTLITEWDFFNEAGWINWQPSTAITASGQSDDGLGSILSTGPLSTDLCWGSPSTSSGQSCLDIDSPKTQNSTQSWDENGIFQDINGGSAQGRVQTVAANTSYESGFKDGTSIRHRNFIITGDSLENVTLVDGLQLQGFYNTNETTGSVLAPELEFSINFNETRNSGDSTGACPFGPNSGTAGSINENGCADIFTVLGFQGGNILAQGSDFIDFSVDFVVNGLAPDIHKRYELITRLSGLQTIAGTFGFATEENQVNVLSAQLAVRAIPEPSTVGVLALGLIGLTLAGRRKKS